jgi:transposase InsO family protein
MVIDMNDSQLNALADLSAFVMGTAPVQFALAASERYAFIERTLRRFGYVRLRRVDKAVVLRFLEHVSGYSRQQLTRLVRRTRDGVPLATRYRPPVVGFVRTYSAADVALLASTDTLHGTLSGPATKKLMERAYSVFGDAAYVRLAGLSVAHLYNLRRRAGYLKLRMQWTKTRPRASAIGQRRAPTPNGCPGYLRVDSVHQGDQDGIKGVYHINAVDAVTQFEIVATCERISEAFLLPVLKQMLASFPFVILGFHSDNGSEYVNHLVAKLLNKLLIEFTKSRPRHSNDNALAESKNAAVVRKHLGYAHIPQCFASQVNAFCRDFLNPYVNFHRPCLFAETQTDAKGKQRKIYPYRLMMTPYDKLKSLPNASKFLKPGETFQKLDAFAKDISDNEAARQLNSARSALFQSIANRSQSAA